jgi:clan AA aspartic protease (TIGR02281 family)
MATGGTQMMKFGVIAWFGLAMLQASSVAAEIVVLRAHRNLFRTEVVLNDRRRVAALIDTGATHVFLCAQLARDLGLTLGDTVRLATTGGDIEARRTSLSSVRIGDIEVRDVIGVVQTQDTDCTEAVIGMTLLRRLRALMIAGDTLVLLGPDGAEHK